MSLGTLKWSVEAIVEMFAVRKYCLSKEPVNKVELVYPKHVTNVLKGSIGKVLTGKCPPFSSLFDCTSNHWYQRIIYNVFVSQCYGEGSLMELKGHENKNVHLGTFLF